MKKGSIDFKITHFNFIVKPKEIMFINKKANTYRLQFNKGPQILKKFQQKIHITGQTGKYEFIMQDQCQFKLQNDKNGKCQWAIYQQYDNDSYEFIDSISINIQDYYYRYTNCLKEHYEEYSKIITNKNANMDIIKAAEGLKIKLLPKDISVRQNNKDKTIIICYDIQIKNMVDHLVQLQINRLKKNSLNRVKSNSYISIVDSEKQYQSNSSMERDGVRNDSYKIVINQKVEYGKRSSLLSDIMEESNSNSSNVGLDKKNENQIIQIMKGIPEQQNQSSSPMFSANIKTKSFHHTDKNTQILKRSNTQKSGITQQNDIQFNLDNKKKESYGDQSIDQRLQKEQIQANLRQTRAPSFMKSNQSIIVNEVNSNNKSIIVKIIMIAIMMIALFGSLYFLKVSLARPTKKQKTKLPQKGLQGQKVKKSKKQKKGK